MGRKTIAFDIDGTLADYGEGGWIEASDPSRFTQEFFDAKNLLDNRIPRIIGELLKTCNVGIVTARGYEIDSMPWLQRNGIPIGQLHFYAPAFPPSQRSNILPTLGVDLLIDDDPTPGKMNPLFCPPEVAAADLANRWDVIEQLLMDRGYLYPQLSLSGQVQYVN